MLNLSSTTTVLRVTTGSAGAVSADASWVDVPTPFTTSSSSTPGSGVIASITTATTTTIVAAPAAATVRNVKKATVANTSATVANAVTIEVFDGTNASRQWSGTLLVGERVSLDESGQWIYFAADGTIKATATQSTKNNSVATVSAAYAADTYLAGSSITMPTGGPLQFSTYRLIFDMVKTAAGVATPIINVRFGTAGTTADASLLTFTFGAGTAAVDTGTFELVLVFRSVGAGTSAVVTGTIQCRHSLAATGLTSTGASGVGILTSVSTGFNSTTAGAILGVSFNGGASFSGTNTIVQASFQL